MTDSRYNWEELEQDVPNPNYIALQEVIPKYVDTVRELYRSLTTHYSHGQEYKKSWFRDIVKICRVANPWFVCTLSYGLYQPYQAWEAEADE